MDTNKEPVHRLEDSGQNQSNEALASRRSHKRMLHIILEIILYIAIVLAGIYLLPKYVMQRTIVDGDSMNDTLQTEDNLLVNKISYHFSDPERFDVIVFYPNGNTHPDTFFRFIKRLFTPKTESDNKGVLEDDYYVPFPLLAVSGNNKSIILYLV